MKKLIIRLIILGVIVGAAWGGYRFVQSLPEARTSSIATAKVRKGDVIVRTFSRGELRAVRSAVLFAPNLFGTVQITKLAEIGAFAKEKDLIIEFDDAELVSSVEEKQLEMDQIDEQFKKSEADLAIRSNQDQVELLRARYSVRRAELEVKRNELLSAIDRKKNDLNLEEAKRRLSQLESDIKSRHEQAEAELAVLRERKSKAQLEMARYKSRLNQVKVLAPMSGLVAIRQNSSSRMGFGFDVPDIREGDQVQPGMQVADVLDLSELEVVARVGELDRANLSEDQEVVIALDAVPNEKFKGKIKTMSSTASSNVNSSDPAKKFDVIFSIDMKELLTKLGAKPDQIQRILATAEANRKRPTPSGGGLAAAMAGGGMPGGMPGGFGGFGGGAGGPGGGGFGGRGPGGEGGGGPRMPFAAGGGAPGAGGAAMSDADRTKMREAMQAALKGRSMQDLSAEERTKLIQDVMAKVRGAGAAPAGGRPAAGAKPEVAQAGGDAAAGEGRRRRSGGEGGGPGGEGGGGGRRGGGPGGPGGGGFGGFGGGTGQFSPADFQNAKLPPPPDQDANSNLEVLLRPGLLADVEIIVEKIPNAIHIPAQAVFEKDNKLVVYVKEGERFVARPIKPAKRSESTLVIAEGLRENEVIAMANPEAKPGSKQAKEDKGGGGPMNALPGGKQ
ncbi:MAG: HlyD family efflux transporter periplasmic adaptor subunit [Acidobacteria bacterium]|nr:HlyD family efflux transporter periplasmic adaptor subunit [Acidobacteriota bacterium]